MYEYRDLGGFYESSIRIEFFGYTLTLILFSDMIILIDLNLVDGFGILICFCFYLNPS